jgi:energy-coupling factor transporter ATP-binding protein EcfA2
VAVSFIDGGNRSTGRKSPTCRRSLADYVIQLMESVKCVIVTGSSGNGKSALVHHVALQMQKEQNYEIIPFVVELADIIRYSDPRKKQVFVIDDICGKVTVNVQTVDWWYTHLDQIEKILEKGSVKLLASCRLMIYNDPRFRCLKYLFTNDCNLLLSSQIN